MSRSTHALKSPNHRLTNAAKHLHHCMLVNQLQCTTPSERFGFLLLWYVSSQGTAIKYAPAMAPHTASCGDTFVNAVSEQPTLSQVATQQALTRHHFLVAQPAPPQPAQCMQPIPAAPTTPATQTNQAPAVPITPAAQKSALAPMPVTSHATPVQPWRSGCACMAPRCLVQEI